MQKTTENAISDKNENACVGSDRVGFVRLVAARFGCVTFIRGAFVLWKKIELSCEKIEAKTGALKRPKPDQNEKSTKVCKTASLIFSLFHVHWLSSGATLYAIAGPLAVYTKIRDVPEETKFVILYPKFDFFC